MKLRWALNPSKVWRDFTHSDGTKDGGYEWLYDNPPVLEYHDEDKGWVEVETVEVR